MLDNHRGIFVVSLGGHFSTLQRDELVQHQDPGAQETGKHDLVDGRAVHSAQIPQTERATVVIDNHGLYCICRGKDARAQQGQGQCGSAARCGCTRGLTDGSCVLAAIYYRMNAMHAAMCVVECVRIHRYVSLSCIIPVPVPHIFREEVGGTEFAKYVEVTCHLWRIDT